MTAPATVSDERRQAPTGQMVGKDGPAETRESGDLPSCFQPTQGGESWKEALWHGIHVLPKLAPSGCARIFARADLLFHTDNTVSLTGHLAEAFKRLFL